MIKKFILNRDVTNDEAPWLCFDQVDETNENNIAIKKGTVVYECTKYDYGCVDQSVGIFVTYKEDGDYPGFEIPYNALEKIKENDVSTSM